MNIFFLILKAMASAEKSGKWTQCTAIDGRKAAMFKVAPVFVWGDLHLRMEVLFFYCDVCMEALTCDAWLFTAFGLICRETYILIGTTQ